MMDIPPLLKRAISELDVNLEEELLRYQYWRKHGRAPSKALQFTQRSKPVMPPLPPLETPAPPSAPPPPPPEDPLPPPPPLETEATQTSWFDWQTAFAAVVITIVLGTVGYIGAELLTIDRVLEEQPAPTPPPVSVRPPLPDPSIENMPPVESTPPPGEKVVEQDQPIVVYKVVVDRQYLAQVQQIEPGAFVRPSDNKVQVAVFNNLEDAQRLIDTLLQKDIPAQLE
jgi:hypothetical protein